MMSALWFLCVTLLVGGACAEWRWEGKVAVVTGASSGIGAATALALADRGVKVVGLARREDKIKELNKKTNGTIEAIKCDVSNEKDVVAAFEKVKDLYGGVDVLVNNAGIVRWSALSNGSVDDWRATFDVNVIGLSICTREALKTMRSRGDNGNIININSVVGHSVPRHTLTLSSGVYPATKFAVTALTETLRLELLSAGSKIKVTSLSPGYVFTDIVQALPDEIKSKFSAAEELPSLTPEDIAESVVYILNTKSHVQIKELTIQPLESLAWLNKNEKVQQ